MNPLNIINSRLSRIIQFYTGWRVLLAFSILLCFAVLVVHPFFGVIGIFLLLILFGNTVMGIQKAQVQYIEQRLKEETSQLRYEQTSAVEQFRYEQKEHQKLWVEKLEPLQLDDYLEIIEAQKRIEVQKLDGAIFHVTHWKAGSQWLRNIFEEIYPLDCIVPAEVTDHENLAERIIQPGEIYTPFYGALDRFTEVQSDTKIYRFFVMRDLRDTLISSYFSIKNSHALLDGDMHTTRKRLNNLSQEEGMLYLVNEHSLLMGIMSIQLSWLATDVPVLRYEDIVHNDVQSLSDVFLNRLKLPIDTNLLVRAILKHRFHKKTQGRNPGEEDLNAHYRKGIVGDWENYFSEHLKDNFKKKFGQVLIETGYEQHTHW